MTIEEKAKAYDEALKYANYLINERCKEGTDGSFHCADLQKMFPQLKESEDEKIRKYLISFVELNSGVNLPPEDAEQILAWLEKQGEQKPANDFIEKSQGLDEVEKYILSLVPSRPLNAVKVDAKNLRFLMSKLTTEQEYIINRIMEYLEDNDCPEDWIDFLREICIAPYVKDNRPLVEIGQSYRCAYSPRYTCLSVGDIIYVNDEYTAKLIESLSDAFELLDKD